MELNMELKTFPIGSFIELDDPLTGNRFLAIVCDNGTEFLDYIDGKSPATPLPIFTAMNPIDIGDFRTLKHQILERDYELWETFSEFVSDLLFKIPNYDDLRFMRAVKFGFDTGLYDVAMAIQAAEDKTTEARKRHEALAAIVFDQQDIES